jgi:hypothetical protein
MPRKSWTAPSSRDVMTNGRTQLRRQPAKPLRQEVDDLLCRLIEGQVSHEQAAEWAGRTFNANPPSDGAFDADPGLYETLAVLLDLGPPWNAHAERKDFEKLLKRFRAPEPTRTRRKGSAGK